MNGSINSKMKRGSGIGTFFTTLLLVVAIGVFCFAGWKLFGYWQAYKAGSDEYKDLNDRFVTVSDAGSQGSGSGTGSGTGSAAGENSSESAGLSVGQALATGPQANGVILQSVEELEDPATVDEKIAEAAVEETLENGEAKQLPLLRNPINFTELNAINPDIIGWIRIGALNLSYPVAQAADNDYYLHRTFEGQDNFAGCIFLNCDNSKFFTDQNSIVYGHNMKNGSMFGTLKKFREQETWDTNSYFWIFTPTLIYQYRIFSSAEVATVGDPYRVRFTTADFQSFLDDMTSHSLLKTGVQVTTDDRIVTLSTCTGNTSTRFIVQGRLEQMCIAK